MNTNTKINAVANIDFLSQQNTQMLWEVLLEDATVQQTNPQTLKQFIPMFKPNMNSFYSNQKNKNYDLINLNKLFLKNILNVFQNFVYSIQTQNQTQTQQQIQTQSQEFKKIKIGNEEVGEVYKIEDIQNQRLNEFERELSKKVNDFENFNKPKMPAPLDFSDNKEDTKIGGEINLLIEQTIAQRNYDIQQIQNTLMENLNQKHNDEWLKSQNTSVKNDKISLNVKNINVENINTKNGTTKNQSTPNPRNGNEEEPQKKTITWNDSKNETFFYNDINNRINEPSQPQDEGFIFSKLKKIQTMDETQMKTIQDQVHNEEINLLKDLHKKMDEFKSDLEIKISSILGILLPKI